VNILALAARNFCARKHPSALLVRWSAENDQQLHGDAQKEALCAGLWQSTSSDICKEFMRFVDSHDGAHPGKEDSIVTPKKVNVKL
jgi:hypothetical protein